MKTVWIIGASTGIGAATAKLYANAGWRTLISARSAEKLAELAATDADIIPLPLDIADPEQVKTVTDRVISDMGMPDQIIIAAAIWREMGAAEFDRQFIADAMSVNYLGPINMVAALLPHWQRLNAPCRFAITASVAGYRGLPRAIAYGPTKAALINLGETLRVELARYNVSVAVINPGFVDTPMTKTNSFDMPGLITPQEAATAIHAGMQTDRFQISMPLVFTTVMKLVAILPYWLFFGITRRMMG